MEALEIKATLGGTHLNTEPDGDPWQDENDYWHIPVGSDKNISA